VIWDLHHLTVPLDGGGPVPVLLVLERERERLLLAVTVADTPALAHAAEVSVNQLGAPSIIRSLQRKGTRELNEAYLAYLKELGSSPRLVTLAAVTDTRWVTHAADSIRAAIIANKPSTLAGLDSILTELCWTPWPMHDE
jgi:hypothetical protein